MNHPYFIGPKPDDAPPPPVPPPPPPPGLWRKICVPKYDPTPEFYEPLNDAAKSYGQEMADRMYIHMLKAILGRPTYVEACERMLVKFDKGGPR